MNLLDGWREVTWAEVYAARDFPSCWLCGHSSVRALLQAEARTGLWCDGEGLTACEHCLPVAMADKPIEVEA